MDPLPVPQPQSVRALVDTGAVPQMADRYDVSPRIPTANVQEALYRAVLPVVVADLFGRKGFMF